MTTNPKFLGLHNFLGFWLQIERHSWYFGHVWFRQYLGYAFGKLGIWEGWNGPMNTTKSLQKQIKVLAIICGLLFFHSCYIGIKTEDLVEMKFDRFDRNHLKETKEAQSAADLALEKIENVRRMSPTIYDLHQYIKNEQRVKLVDCESYYNDKVCRIYQYP